MSTSRPRGVGAVMADKASAAAIEAELDPLRKLYLTLNYFPTPPWATRALMEHVIPFASGRCWEPAAGEGHMASVLGEYFDEVWRTDVHDHGGLHAVGSFIGDDLSCDEVELPALRPRWVITNPPFKLGLEFALRALDVAEVGVALLVRTAWLEGEKRYSQLFQQRRPSVIAQFVERVPMTLGRWDPEADTATSYAWIVWDGIAMHTDFEWIPPCRDALTRPDDAARFATPATPETESFL